MGVRQDGVVGEGLGGEEGRKTAVRMLKKKEDKLCGADDAIAWC